MKLRDLKGLGEKSEENLSLVGITSVEQLMAADPFVLYKELKEKVPGTSLNMLYAIIGARENISWQQVVRERKTEILVRLDDMGIA